MPNSMTNDDACIRALAESNVPLKSSEVFSRIWKNKDKWGLTLSGKTPQNNISARLGVLARQGGIVKENGKYRALNSGEVGEKEPESAYPNDLSTMKHKQACKYVVEHSNSVITTKEVLKEVLSLGIKVNGNTPQNTISAHLGTLAREGIITKVRTATFKSNNL